MLSSFFKLVSDLRSSYWFVPSIMVIGALGALTGLVYLDSQDPLGAVTGLDFLNWGTPEGVRTLLASIASSMITVAGVTFSVTIVVVSHASTQLGPRLLTNFMQDRGNQVTLGTFIATFIYALLLMRVVDGGAKTADAADVAAPFVPHLAVTFAILMAVVSTIVLIYFLHHVPAQIHTSNVVATLGRKLSTQLDAAFENQVGAGDSDPAPYAPDRPVEAFHAPTGGYIQYLDLRALGEIAEAENGQIHLAVHAGDYIGQGEALLWIVADKPLTDDTRDKLASTYVTSARRTPSRDLEFLVDELCEIASRALSPGINDPYTAMSCMDWLTSALGQLHGRSAMSAVRRNEAGVVRVVSRSMTFVGLLEHALDQVRPYFCQDRNAALHLQRRLARLALESDDATRREALLAQLRILESYSKPHLHADDLNAMSARNAQVVDALEAGTAASFALANPWVTGRL